MSFQTGKYFGCSTVIDTCPVVKVLPCTMLVPSLIRFYSLHACLILKKWLHTTWLAGLLNACFRINRFYVWLVLPVTAQLAFTTLLPCCSVIIKETWRTLLLSQNGKLLALSPFQARPSLRCLKCASVRSHCHYKTLRRGPQPQNKPSLLEQLGETASKALAASGRKLRCLEWLRLPQRNRFQKGRCHRPRY